MRRRQPGQKRAVRHERLAAEREAAAAGDQPRGRGGRGGDRGRGGSGARARGGAPPPRGVPTRGGRGGGRGAAEQKPGEDDVAEDFISSILYSVRSTFVYIKIVRVYGIEVDSSKDSLVIAPLLSKGDLVVFLCLLLCAFVYRSLEVKLKALKLSALEQTA